MNRVIKYGVAAIAISLLALAGWVAISSAATEREIARHKDTIRQVATGFPSRPVSAEALQALPAPVRRYLAFALPNPTHSFTAVSLTSRGDSRLLRQDLHGFRAEGADRGQGHQVDRRRGRLELLCGDAGLDADRRHVPALHQRPERSELHADVDRRPDRCLRTGMP